MPAWIVSIIAAVLAKLIPQWIHDIIAALKSWLAERKQKAQDAKNVEVLKQAVESGTMDQEAQAGLDVLNGTSTPGVQDPNKH